MHWIIIGLKPAYYLKLFWSMHVVSRGFMISLSRSLCMWDQFYIHTRTKKSMILFHFRPCHFAFCNTSACGPKVHGSYVDRICIAVLCGSVSHKWVNKCDSLSILDPTYICDWIWENPASTHNYKYLEIPNLIIWGIITQEGKQMLAWNLPRFYSYL